MPDPILQPDVPPGAPAYVSGPLAVPKQPAIPSVAAARASGQTAERFLSPAELPMRPVPYATPFAQAPLTFSERATSFAEQARAGLANLFGQTPVAPAPVASANRTAILEADLDKLEKRSTTIPPAAPTFYDRQLAAAK